MAKTPAKRRRRQVVGSVRVPERYQGVVGDVRGVDLLQALYYLSEGERIGREGGQLEGQLREIRAGLVALLESRQAQVSVAPSVVQPKRPPSPGAEDAGETAGVTAQDAQMGMAHVRAAAGGRTDLANAAYARIMDDAANAGQLNSSWRRLADHVITVGDDAEPIEPWDEGR